MAGKGSRRRPTKICKLEEDLRWELIKSTTSEVRKQQIRLQLQQLKKGGDKYCRETPEHT